MSFYVENTYSETTQFKSAPAGSHLGRCYKIIDLGSQKSEYMGEVKVQHKIMIGWELHGDDNDGKPLTMDDKRPLSIFKYYTLSWFETSNLRKDLQSWRGKPWTDAEAVRFDLKTILGAWCMLNVIISNKNGKTYSNVAGITPVPSMIKQAGLPSAVNPNQLFIISDPDMEIYNSLSKSLQEKIASSPEWQARMGRSSHVMSSSKAPNPTIEEMDDDIPF